MPCPNSARYACLINFQHFLLGASRVPQRKFQILPQKSEKSSDLYELYLSVFDAIVELTEKKTS
jgi:hypothetical protein